MLHRVIGDDDGFTRLGVEADRRAFLGRHGSAARPAGMEGEALSGTLGWTLDPVCAVRLRIELPPHGRRELAFVTIAAASQTGRASCGARVCQAVENTGGH